MALPESIQQAADYADAIGKKFSGVSNQQAATNEGAVTEPTGNVGQQPESEVDANEVEKLRSRYSSLQGKYNSEVPRLNQRNRELESELQRLLEDNKRLRGEVAEREQATAYLTDQDADTFGADMVDFVRRGAKEESAKYSQIAADLKGQVDELRAQLQATQQQSMASAQERFYQELSSECPGWEAQDKDEGFIEWLSQADPVLGVRRQDALDRAAGMMDGRQVAKIFNQYRTWKQQKLSDNPLARQVAPSHATGGASQPSSGRTWSQAEIASFYDACRRGEIVGEQKRQIEQEIDNAVATGRVTA